MCNVLSNSFIHFILPDWNLLIAYIISVSAKWTNLEQAEVNFVEHWTYNVKVKACVRTLSNQVLRVDSHSYRRDQGLTDENAYIYIVCVK